MYDHLLFIPYRMFGWGDLEGRGREGWGGGFEVEVMKGFITFVWILL